MVRDKDLRQKLAAACGNQSFMVQAPITVVALGRDIHFDRGGYMGAMSMLVDVSIGFTHLVLAARADGLGTCWIGAFDNEAVKKLLGIRADLNVVALTPLGYPLQAEFAGPGPRISLDEIVVGGIE